jgi:hypothetical protein
MSAPLASPPMTAMECASAFLDGVIEVSLSSSETV